MKRLFLNVFGVLVFGFSVQSQVGIGTLSPNSSAMLDVTSTTKAFLPPRMSMAQIAAIANPVNGMMVYCTNCDGNQGCLQVYEGGTWRCTNEEKIIARLCGSVRFYFTIYHLGYIWLDRNLAAASVADSADDYAGYGGLFQWGRLKSGNHCCITWTDGNSGTPLYGTTTTQLPNNTTNTDFVITHADWTNNPDNTLWSSAKGVNDPCPDGFRLPTMTELSTCFNFADPPAAAASALRVPAAGRRLYTTGALSETGVHGWYWSCTTDPTLGAYYAHIIPNGGGVTIGPTLNKAFGFSVRCISQ